MKKSRKNNKKEMRALVIRMYNGLGALLALLGIICLGGIETTVKDFNGTVSITPIIIGLVALAVGAYMIVDGHKHERAY